MAETGSAVFRAIADWAQLRREARRTAKDLKDTRGAARDLDDSLGDVDKSADGASTRLRRVGESARASDRDVQGLLGSIRSWSQTRARAVLGIDATRAKEEIRRLKDDLAGLRVTRLGIDADTTRARAQIQDVQSELDRLRSQPASAQVDADIAAAVAKINELKARIASLRSARLQVDADTARARAQLAAVSRDADQLGRKKPTIRVDADTSKIKVLGAALAAVAAAAALIGPVLGAVTALAAGLFSVVAAAAPAAGGLLAVAAAAGAAAQAAGTAAIALSGVGKAVKALQSRQEAAGGSAASTAKAQEAAADRIATAQQGVTRAIEQRTRTAIQGSQAVESAERSLAGAVESSARRIAAAERAHADAVRDVSRARADLNRELQDAKERMEDLALAVEGGRLDEEAAVIRIKRAQQELDDVRRKGGSELDVAEAQNAYDQAVFSLKEIRERNEDLQKQQEKTAKSGVDGDDQVVAAKDRVADAVQAEQDAEAELDQARVDGRREVEDAERQLGQTIQQTAWANADAQQGVADATRELEKAYRDAATAADSGGGGRAADDFDRASPAAQRFARFLNDEVLPALRRVRDEVQAQALPLFETAIRTALPLLDLFGGRLADTGRILGELAVRGANMITSGPWTADFGTILDSNNRIIGTLGSALLVAADATRILWVTAGPLAERLASLVLRGTESARAFLESARASGQLAEFTSRAGDVITQLLRISGDFLVALFNIGKAAAPAGQILLDSLESVAQKFRELTGSVEGQTRMRQFFLDMVPTVQELGRLFVDLLGVFGRVASNPDTADFIKQIRTELLPALDRLMTSLGDGVVPQLISLASHAADVISELGGGALLGFVTTLNGIASALSWILSIPGLGDFVGLILTLAGTGYALKLVGGAITGIAEALKYLSPVLDIVITGVRALAVALAANPLVLIITGIALAALLIITHWDTVKRWLAEFWQWIKDAAQAVWDFLVGLFGNNAVTDTISGAWDSVKNTTAAAWDRCKQTIGAAWDWMTQKTSAAAGIVGGTISGAWDSIKNNTGQAWDSVKNTVSGAWDWITGASDRGSGSLRGVLQGVVDTLGSTFAGAWDAAWNKVAAVWDGISNTVRGAVDYISNLIDWISNKISNAWNAVTNFASSAASAIIPGYAEGGMVGGTGSGDNQIIRATAGEWVVPKDVTARFLPFLKAITFGSVRSLTQIIQPEQAKLIQDRLAGVPELSQLSGLRELITGVQGATSTTLDTTDNSRSVNVVTNVYNPIAEPASDSVTDRMRTLALMGVFS